MFYDWNMFFCIFNIILLIVIAVVIVIFCKKACNYLKVKQQLTQAQLDALKNKDINDRGK